MSRIRSKKLYRFLEEQGALSNPREIRRLKREYRRQYQNTWQRQQRKKQQELRFTITKEEYQKVKISCQKESITPSELAKDLLLSYSRSEPFVTNKEELLAVAKELGLSIHRLKAGEADPTLNKLLSAETRLLTYLNL